MPKNDETEQIAPKKIKTPTTLGRRSTEGAWLTYAQAMSTVAPEVQGVYPDKASAGDAIIAALEQGGEPLRRVFVPWGLTLDEVLFRG